MVGSYSYLFIHLSGHPSIHVFVYLFSKSSPSSISLIGKQVIFTSLGQADSGWSFGSGSFLITRKGGGLLKALSSICTHQSFYTRSCIIARNILSCSLKRLIIVGEAPSSRAIPATADENKLPQTQSCCSGKKEGGDSL